MVKLNFKLIKDFFKNTKTTSQEATYNCNYINDITQKDYIKVVSTQSQKYASVGSLNVSFNSQEFKNGTKLQLYNGQIQVVSNNVHHVKVSATLWIERHGNSYAWCRLLKNNNIQISYMLAPAVNSGNPWDSITLETIMAVSQNDYIYPQVYFNEANADNQVNGGYDHSVSMYVEVID